MKPGEVLRGKRVEMKWRFTKGWIQDMWEEKYKLEKEHLSGGKKAGASR